MFSIIYVCLQEKKIFSKERNNPFCSSSKSGSPESLKKSALEKKKKQIDLLYGKVDNSALGQT